MADEIGGGEVDENGMVVVRPKMEVSAQVVDTLQRGTYAKKVKKEKVKYPGGIEDDSLMLFMDLMKDIADIPAVAARKEDFFDRIGPPSCFLCYDYPYPNANMSRLRRHFAQCHMNHSVNFPNATVVICKLNCDGLNCGHYHCPKANCPIYLFKKDRLVAHYLKHFEDVKEKDKNTKTLDHRRKKKKLKFPPPSKV